MRRRLFFALNFDQRTIAAIRNFRRDVEDRFGRENMPRFRFMSEDNWHLTVLFLGEEDDAELPAIMRAAKNAMRYFAPPDIVFEKISYAPRKDAPRMIWIAAAEASSRAAEKLRNLLEDELAKEKVPFPRDRRPFSGHVTLARLSETAGTGGGDLPDILRAVHAAYLPASLDLMESELGKHGATYTVLQKFPFSPNN